MNQIARCDWLLEKGYLAARDFSLVSQDQRSFLLTNPLLTKLVRSRCLDIGQVLFLCVYGPRLRLGP